jgi:hypothetical protein
MKSFSLNLPNGQKALILLSEPLTRKMRKVLRRAKENKWRTHTKLREQFKELFAWLDRPVEERGENLPPHLIVPNFEFDSLWGDAQDDSTIETFRALIVRPGVSVEILRMIDAELGTEEFDDFWGMQDVVAMEEIVDYFLPPRGAAGRSDSTDAGDVGDQLAEPMEADGEEEPSHSDGLHTGE